MSTFIVEFRNSNTFAGDAVEGYLGTWVERHPRDEELDREVWGVVSERSEAFEFTSVKQADRQLNRLPDALFDRYYPTTVEVEVEVS